MRAIRHRWFSTPLGGGVRRGDRCSPRFRRSRGIRPGPKIVTSREVESLILEQVETLRTLASEVGLPVRFLKPHGALYNQAQTQELVALGVLLAARRLGLPLLVQPGTLLERLARGLDVRMIAEGFPDRRYRGPDALVHAARRARSCTTPWRSSFRSSGWSRRNALRPSAFTVTSQARSRMQTSSGKSLTATGS